MVVNNDAALAERIRILRGHGANPKYYHQLVGGNFRLDALQAAVLRAKLKYLDGWTMARQRHAAIYRQSFAESGLVEENGPIILPCESGFGRHIYNQFVIRARKRNDLIVQLKAKKIGCEVYYPVPLHLQECFHELGYHAGDFPESEKAAADTLALPIYPELSQAMQVAVVQAIDSFYRGD